MHACILGPYVIAVSEADCIGEIMENQVFRVLKVRILPCVLEGNLSSQLLQDEMIFLGLLSSFLNDHRRSGLYFSRGYELTHRLQKQYTRESTVDDQFVANRRILGNLLLPSSDLSFKSLSRFILPCIQGFVGVIEDIDVDSQQRIGIALISRRSSSRVGIPWC
jgi:hypothetical protein